MEVLIDEPGPALLCQPGIGMAMHGCVKSGSRGRTSTRSCLTPSCQLTNLMRQNSLGLVPAHEGWIGAWERREKY